MEPADGPAVHLELVDLRELITAAKEFSPRLARELRRDLRRSADGVIAEQRAILAGPLPKGVVVTGKRLKRIMAKGKKRAYIRAVNTYGEAEVKNQGRGRGMRQQISAGLKARVVAGKTRQGFELKTTGPRDGGYNMAKVWQRKRFRHPVFADSATQTSADQVWVYQSGQPYFWDPVHDGGLDEMRNRASDAISRTLAAMSKE